MGLVLCFTLMASLGPPSTCVTPPTIILEPVVGNRNCHVKNSYEFASFIKGIKLMEDKELVPFDVVSLFMNIPVYLAIRVTEQRLSNDTTLAARTPLAVADIIVFLEFCLSSINFSFCSKHYCRVFGTTMGSPVSTIIANLVMEDVEQQALSSSTIKPSFWKRYVDYTISAMKKHEIPHFLAHVNSTEHESNSAITFLDTLFQTMGR